MNKYLIVVDVQNDFVYGSLGTPEAQAIIPRIREKIEECRKHGYKIIFTRDTHYDWSYLTTNEGRHLPIEHCVAGTDGWCLVDGLCKWDDDLTVTKEAFGYQDWRFVIEEDTRHIGIIGLCTDICVISNALILKSLFPEANIVVDSSACAGSTPASHDAALKVMKSCQVEVI